MWSMRASGKGRVRQGDCGLCGGVVVVEVRLRESEDQAAAA